MMSERDEDHEDIDTLEQFLSLSERLTGYDSATLQGTGLVEEYYNLVQDIVGGRIFGRLLGKWEEVKHKPPEIFEKEILPPRSDSMYGPIARNIIKLWYLGQWTRLPRAWRQQWGAHAKDTTHVISPAAFREGLAWDAIGAHPPTAKSPGFGTWTSPPSKKRPPGKKEASK